MKRYIKSSDYFSGMGGLLEDWFFWGSTKEEGKSVIQKIINIIKNEPTVFVEWGEARNLTGIDYRRQKGVEKLYNKGFDAYPVPTDVVISNLTRFLAPENNLSAFNGISLRDVSNRYNTKYLLSIDNGSISPKNTRNLGSDHLWD